MENRQGLFYSFDHAFKTSHLFVNMGHRRIQADPEITQRGVSQLFCNIFYLVRKFGAVVVHKEKSIGTGTDIWNAGISCMPDQFGQILSKEHGLSASKRDGLNPFFSRRVDDLFDLVCG